MNLTKKISVLGMSSLLLMVTMSGCGKKPAPQQVYNKNISGPMLYVEYYYGDFLKIDNSLVRHPSSVNAPQGFSLNNYNPLGFKTAKTKLGDGSLWGSNVPRAVGDIKYNYVECDDSTTQVLVSNIFGGIITLGYRPITGGYCHHNMSYFNYENFDKDVKEWVSDNNINREELLLKYAKLTKLAENANKDMSKVNEDISEMYSQEYAKLSANYISKSPILINNYIDKSGLYKKEKLPNGVNIAFNTVTQKSFNNNINNNYRYVNAAFPCADMKECLANMDKAKENIDTKSVSSIAEVKSNANKWLKLSKEQLVKDTSQYKLDFSDKDLVVIVGDKTINYKIKTKSVIKAGKKAKKVKVTYEIKSFAYKNVIPSFSNNNRDIAILFDPKTHNITLANMTDEYILIKSIDLYYNGDIVKLGESKQKNFSSELSPQSESKFKMSRYIEKANYSNVTKRTALNTSVEFGFSIRYTLGDSTKNRTLYKKNTQSLYSIVSKL